MTKHSPQIRLINARAAVKSAREQCPHWDYESDYDGWNIHDCCSAVDAAYSELRLAKAAQEARS